MIYLKILLAIVCGGLVGYEREKKHKPAGIRTFIFVVVGSVLIIYISNILNTDLARLPASLIQGIGFLGAGVIWHKKNKVEGITTAAMLIIAVGIGFLIGYNNILLAIFLSVITYIILLINPKRRGKI